MRNIKYKDAAVLVFAKAPIAGEVNTRLIPDVGVKAATRLQDELIHSRLLSFQDNQLTNIQLWCSPDSNHDFFQACKKRYTVDLFDQQGEDLGERMSFAISQSLKKFKRVVLIGTDAPSLSMEQIELAINKLGNDNELVIVPAEDGGYVLIGMTHHHPEIFQSIPWGSDQVLALTREVIKLNNLVVEEFESCWDIDRLADYLRYKNMTS